MSRPARASDSLPRDTLSHNALTPGPDADMVALYSADRRDLDGVALANTALTETLPTNTAGTHPDQYWDGRRETLGSWFTEFETTLSTASPELYELAVEFLLSDRTKTVILVPGQAAQLDGALPRPDYTWANPAPSDPAACAVQHGVTTAVYMKFYDGRRLRDPSLDPTPPIVPADTHYPIDGSKYVPSAAQLHN